MSINGINAGVGAFPNCAPDAKHIGGICSGLTEILGDLAYNSFVQGILFQANYFRDPSKTDSDKYKKYVPGDRGGRAHVRRAPRLARHPDLSLAEHTCDERRPT